jgi:hypothetical protein
VQLRGARFCEDEQEEGNFVCVYISFRDIGSLAPTKHTYKTHDVSSRKRTENHPVPFPSGKCTPRNCTLYLSELFHIVHPVGCDKYRDPPVSAFRVWFEFDQPLGPKAICKVAAL